MSTSVFPTLNGLGWGIVREPNWDGTTLIESASGKRTAVSNWTYPRWSWQLTFNYLYASSAQPDFQNLAGFFNTLRGQADTFLYQDADDNAVTAQALGVGDGSTTAFPLARTFGGFVEPVYAPNVVSHVYKNGVNQASGWSVSQWGSATPGVLTFTSAPANGTPISADFSFYFPCRFDDTKISFTKFLNALYKADTVPFSSEK